MMAGFGGEKRHVMSCDELTIQLVTLHLADILHVKAGCDE